MVSTFGCANGLILAGARLTYAIARDGLFFTAVGRLNRFGVPAAGLLLQSGWAALLIFSGSYSELLDYVIFAALLFYILTVAAVFVLRQCAGPTCRVRCGPSVIRSCRPVSGRLPRWSCYRC